MYPDGGIVSTVLIDNSGLCHLESPIQARFRVYGNVTPILPANVAESFDLAHVFAGGRVEFVSDQHFGVGANLILPGRGETIITQM